MKSEPAKTMSVRESITRLSAYIEYRDVTEDKQSKQTQDLILMLLKRKAGLIQ